MWIYACGNDLIYKCIEDKAYYEPEAISTQLTSDYSLFLGTGLYEAVPYLILIDKVE